MHKTGLPNKTLHYVLSGKIDMWRNLRCVCSYYRANFSLGAGCFGVKIIDKNFILDFTMGGRDSSFSIYEAGLPA